VTFFTGYLAQAAKKNRFRVQGSGFRV